MRLPPGLLIATLLAPALTGCGQSESGQESPKPAKTVSWLFMHRDELQATLSTCRENPGELAKTPDCVNASAARDKIIVQEMKDALKRSPR